MDRTNDAFYDDSSSAMGLGHSAIGRGVQTETSGWVRGKNQDEESAQYRKELLESGALDWIIEYHKHDKANKDRRPSEIVDLSASRYNEIRPGTHMQVRMYVEVHKMNLTDAMMKADSDLSQADEAFESDARKPKDAYLGDSVANLMDAHKKTTGGGSKSKRHAPAQKPTVGKCENCRSPLTADLAVCQECGHEVQRRDPRGRRRFGEELRVVVSARVDPETPGAFGQNEQILGLWIDLCAKFARAGLRVEDVQLAVLDEDVA